MWNISKAFACSDGAWAKLCPARCWQCQMSNVMFSCSDQPTPGRLTFKCPVAFRVRIPCICISFHALSLSAARHQLAPDTRLTTSTTHSSTQRSVAQALPLARRTIGVRSSRPYWPEILGITPRPATHSVIARWIRNLFLALLHRMRCYFSYDGLLLFCTGQFGLESTDLHLLSNHRIALRTFELPLPSAS